MANLTPFSNEEFQIDVIPDGGSFNVAAPGLAKSLGFAEARDMLRSIPEDEKGSELSPITLVSGEKQHRRITFVTEAGFYRALGNRQAARVKNEAIRAQVERFQSWIYGEVLPSIRRHGAYMTEHTIEQVLTDPDTLIKLATDLKEERTRRAELEETAQIQAPKIEYHDTYVAESDQISFRTVASTLGIKERELRESLIEHRWIFREKTTRRSGKTGEVVPQYRCSEYADKKPYFIRRQDHDAPRFRGEVDHTLKITPAGATAIKRALKKWGGIPADSKGEDLEPGQGELFPGDEQ